MNTNDFKINSTDTINFQEEKYYYLSSASDQYWLQSLCYIPIENSIVTFYHGSTNTLIQKISTSTYQVTSSFTSFNYIHANDVTYNPNTQKIYLVPMYGAGTGFDRNLIFVLNKNTLVKESEIHIGNDTSISVSAIAYDSTNNNYYAEYDGDIVKLDSSFNIVDTFPLNVDGISMNSFQNLEVYDSKLFAVYNDKILVFDSSGSFIKNIAIDSTIETEGFASLGNGNFLIGKVYDYYPHIFRSSLLLCNIFDEGLNNTLITAHAKITTKNNANIASDINYITKRDRTVYCNICFTNISSTSLNAIGELPPGFRPSTYKRVIGACSGDNFVRFEIDPDGKIIIYGTSLPYIQTSYWFHLDTTFIID